MHCVVVVDMQCGPTLWLIVDDATCINIAGKISDGTENGMAWHLECFRCIECKIMLEGRVSRS